MSGNTPAHNNNMHGCSLDICKTGAVKLQRRCTPAMNSKPMPRRRLQDNDIGVKRSPPPAGCAARLRASNIVTEFMNGSSPKSCQAGILRKRCRRSTRPTRNPTAADAEDQEGPSDSIGKCLVVTLYGPINDTLRKFIGVPRVPASWSTGRESCDGRYHTVRVPLPYGRTGDRPPGSRCRQCPRHDAAR